MALPIDAVMNTNYSAEITGNDQLEFLHKNCKTENKLDTKDS